MKSRFLKTKVLFTIKETYNKTLQKGKLLLVKKVDG